MTRNDLTTRLSAAHNIPMRQARLIVDAFFGGIAQSVLNDDKVILRGFGSFSVKETQPHQSRNPQTGENIWVDARKSLVFKAGSELREKLNTTK